MAGMVLNDQQKEAITHGQGPLLIIAGAGTGKTTVVAERIKHLVLKKNVLPSQILALTFNEKAAREMEERVDVQLPYGYIQMWISTFHAFCDRIQRSEAIHIGLTPTYKLMSEAEAILFLRTNIFQFQLKYFRPLGNPYKFLQGLLQHFSRLKDEDVSPSEYLQWAQAQSSIRQLAGKAQSEGERLEAQKTLELANAYKTYEDLKVHEGAMDFSDLISNTLKLFRDRKNVLKQYQNQFKYILVDEFQDTNFAQNQLAILLAGEKKNITVVGDDDQAIYRWRGAAISNMVQFRKQFERTKIVTLTKNYRSTKEILQKSYQLIQYNNPDRLEVKESIDKKLISARNLKGTLVEFLFADRVENEAEEVIKKIIELTSESEKTNELNNHYLYKDIAILVRANDHSSAFVRTLSRHNIPYQFLGPGRLFHQEEIKDLIAYLKVLYNFEDSASLYRILAMPLFQIVARDIAALLNVARKKNLSLFETLEHEASTNELILKTETKEKVKQIVEMVHRHLKLIPKNSAGQILYYFLEDSGLIQQLLQSKTEKEIKASQNISRFFEKLKSYETEHEDASVFAVVDWIDLSMQMGESPIATDTDWGDINAVNILTIHSSKGLEFPVVFLVNLVTQRFPTRERREQIPIPQELIKEILPEGDFHTQEERRLCYVGMTRARDYLFLTAANFYGEGKRERRLSPFLYEALGKEYIEQIVNSNKSKQSVIQPSLLDWSNDYVQNQPSTKDQRPTTIPITYLSYSQLQTFDICPLHYKLRYILKIPSEPTAALSFGSSIHSALRDFLAVWIKDRAIDPNSIVAYLEKVWSEEGYGSKTHEQKAFEQAKVILTRYIKNNFGTLKPKAKPVALELPFTFSLTNPSGRVKILKIGGRIDRVDKLTDNRIEIIDYKTGSNVPSEKEIKNDLQLTLYTLAATMVNDPILSKKPEDVLLSLHYLGEDKILTTTRTAQQLEEAKKLIFEKVEEIEQSSFECSGSSICRDCEYKILCSVH